MRRKSYEILQSLRRANRGRNSYLHPLRMRGKRKNKSKKQFFNAENGRKNLYAARLYRKRVPVFGSTLLDDSHDRKILARRSLSPPDERRL